MTDPEIGASHANEANGRPLVFPSLYKDDMGLIRAYALEKISRKEPKLKPSEPQLLLRFSAEQGEEE